MADTTGSPFEASELLCSLLTEQHLLDLGYARGEHLAVALGEAGAWRREAAARFHSASEQNAQKFWAAYREWVRQADADFRRDVVSARAEWVRVNQPRLAAASGFGTAEVMWPMRLTSSRISGLATSAEAAAREAAFGGGRTHTSADLRDEYLGQRWSTPLSRELVSDMLLVLQATAQNSARFAGAADRIALAVAARAGAGPAAAREAVAGSGRAARVIAAAIAVNSEAGSAASHALIRAKAAAE